MTGGAALPLEGIRVLDLTQVMAGPFCASLMGALGAEVIKLESTARMEAARVRGADGSGIPGAFHTFNHSKRSITLNLSVDGASELARQIAAKSDVVLTAFRPGALRKFGLDYEGLRAIKPDIIVLSISGYGQDGPYARYGAYAAIFCAMGGVSYLTGYPNGGLPTEWRASGDLRVGTVSFAAVMASILRLRRTGRGGHIDLAGREVASMLIGDALVAAQTDATPPAPAGNDDRIMAPHQVFRSANPDEWVALAVGSDGEWKAFCEAAGLRHLHDDPRYGDGFLRWKHKEELNELVGAWMLTQDARSVIEGLQQRGVSASFSARMDQLATDEHLREREFWERLALPGGDGNEPRVVSMPGAPWQIDGARDFFQPEPGVPMGQDNEYVYRELLGLDKATYEHLVESGVIA